MKTKLLKSLFILISFMIMIFSIGTLSFLMINNSKMTYYDYVWGFFIFMVQFLTITIIFGGFLGLIYFPMVKLYNKLFTKK